MRIPCPHCGPRGLEEFLYHGDATVKRLEALGWPAGSMPFPVSKTALLGAAIHGLEQAAIPA